MDSNHKFNIAITIYNECFSNEDITDFMSDLRNRILDFLEEEYCCYNTDIKVIHENL